MKSTNKVPDPIPKARPRRPLSELSDRQAEIVAWVLVYRRINATWPSYREIMDAFDMASTNSAHMHLARITRAGYLVYRGVRDFKANFDLIRSSKILERVPWIAAVPTEAVLFVPTPLHITPEVLTRFPRLASALANG